MKASHRLTIAVVATAFPLLLAFQNCGQLSPVQSASTKANESTTGTPRPESSPVVDPPEQKAAIGSVVAVYEAETKVGGVFATTVNITTPGEHILVLSSYSKIRWTIVKAVGVTIKRVVVNAYESGSSVEGVESAVVQHDSLGAYPSNHFDLLPYIKVMEPGLGAKISKTFSMYKAPVQIHFTEESQQHYYSSISADAAPSGTGESYVFLDKPGQHTLILSSAGPTHWKIRGVANAKLVRAVVIGHNGQMVDNSTTQYSTAHRPYKFSPWSYDVTMTREETAQKLKSDIARFTNIAVRNVYADTVGKTGYVVSGWQPEASSTGTHVAMYEPPTNKKVTIKIQKPGPHLLVLSSYRSVEWKIETSNGAEVAQIILYGYEAHTVVGVPAGKIQNYSGPLKLDHFTADFPYTAGTSATFMTFLGKMGIGPAQFMGAYTGAAEYMIQ